MLSSKLFYLILLLILIAAFIGWQMTQFKAPEPKYTLLQSDKNIEIRLYPALLIAEIQMPGKRETAINLGFKALANYIFGNNLEQTKIAMTAPVIQQAVKGDKSSVNLLESANENWKVRFILPASFSSKNLPKPNNNAISIVEIPENKYVVIRFSGSSSTKNLKLHEEQLQNYITKHQLKTDGQAIYAFYNPPWILPIFRRNEIMFELAS